MLTHNALGTTQSLHGEGGIFHRPRTQGRLGTSNSNWEKREMISISYIKPSVHLFIRSFTIIKYQLCARHPGTEDTEVNKMTKSQFHILGGKTDPLQIKIPMWGGEALCHTATYWWEWLRKLRNNCRLDLLIHIHINVAPVHRDLCCHSAWEWVE